MSRGTAHCPTCWRAAGARAARRQGALSAEERCALPRPRRAGFGSVGTRPGMLGAPQEGPRSARNFPARPRGCGREPLPIFPTAPRRSTRAFPAPPQKASSWARGAFASGREARNGVGAAALRCRHSSAAGFPVSVGPGLGLSSATCAWPCFAARPACSYARSGVQLSLW